MDTVYAITNKLITLAVTVGVRARAIFLPILARISGSGIAIILRAQKPHLSPLKYEVLLNFGARNKERRKPVSGLQFSQKY